MVTHAAHRMSLGQDRAHVKRFKRRNATARRMAQVSRAVQTRSPCSSVMTISYQAIALPSRSGVATPVTVPDADALVMGGVEVDADGDAAVQAGGMQRGADRAERLGQDAGGAAVQQAVGLGVALNRHGADDALGRRLGDSDAHADG